MPLIALIIHDILTVCLSTFLSYQEKYGYFFKFRRYLIKDTLQIPAIELE